ncbi:uracil phosphoribosyltransferase-like protein [Aureobasidium sp. EXF-8845]|nr:uracil phosphoribosyltransferase-like protein [Aureobasidium sp. EXF-8846]KAI4833949.1 uracil phosphoribosyltransferase-like protein [Aureobasidium sp. EXF-8845]
MSSLPSNVHVSQHPCLRAKVSQLRSQQTGARDAKRLIHDISTMLGYEALGSALKTTQQGTDKSPLGYDFPVDSISPSHVSLVPILRSGLSMVDALLSVLPDPVPVFHLGMYREKTTLQPVEYYNNLPYHSATTTSLQTTPSETAILLDPIIATGATASAAIDTLKDWGVKRIVVCSVLASHEGLEKVSRVWEEGVEIWVGAVDPGTDAKGMIKPGLGDVGDRLFLTIGK